jgi:sulfur-oxidizing protein SoxY
MNAPTRRVVIASAIGASLLPRPSAADTGRVAGLIEAFVAGATLADGRIRLDLPELVENGNAVTMGLVVDVPQGAAPQGVVREVAVFADGNAQPEVLRLRFGAASGPVAVHTRIRLADSQTVTALARLADGTCWRDRVTLLVTQSACVE